MRFPIPHSLRRITDVVRDRVPFVASPVNRESPLPFVSRRPTVNPVLPVDDMDVAVAFYERIGFAVRRYDAGYAWVRTCSWEIVHLALAAGTGPGASNAGAYVHVDDVDAWHVAMTTVSGGDAAISGIAEQPWGMREFAVTDPAGNVVRFGRHL